MFGRYTVIAGIKKNKCWNYLQIGDNEQYHNESFSSVRVVEEKESKQMAQHETGPEVNSFDRRCQIVGLGWF